LVQRFKITGKSLKKAVRNQGHQVLLSAETYTDAWSSSASQNTAATRHPMLQQALQQLST